MACPYDFSDEVSALLESVPAGDRGLAGSILLGSVVAQLALMCGGRETSAVLYSLADQVATNPVVTE